ncbi:MAG: nucleotide exchange factor GrpE [Bacteroidales bacterium]|nr:nucleotide exchange factor GrpE [Bacteroidales bacterium]MCD8388447.1 nucleotide exchange factor GrpE [Bacteroidales bacterium]
MSDKKKHNNAPANGDQPRFEGEVQNDPTMNLEEATTPASEVQDVERDDSEEAEVADMFKKLQETEKALADKSKDYLFLMADFDNYRKRTVKEKSDIIKNASERILKELLPIVDDFERGLEATKTETDGQQVRQGMELIYNKLVKLLENNGVKPIESTGAEFDADKHDAIATIPAPTDEHKGKVIDTTTKGYTLNDKVLRHAKVVVGEK